MILNLDVQRNTTMMMDTHVTLDTADKGLTQDFVVGQPGAPYDLTGSTLELRVPSSNGVIVGDNVTITDATHGAFTVAWPDALTDMSMDSLQAVFLINKGGKVVDTTSRFWITVKATPGIIEVAGKGTIDGVQQSVALLAQTVDEAQTAAKTQDAEATAEIAKVGPAIAEATATAIKSANDAATNANNAANSANTEAGIKAIQNDYGLPWSVNSRVATAPNIVNLLPGTSNNWISLTNLGDWGLTQLGSIALEPGETYRVGVDLRNADPMAHIEATVYSDAGPVSSPGAIPGSFVDSSGLTSVLTWGPDEWAKYPTATSLKFDIAFNKMLTDGSGRYDYRRVRANQGNVIGPWQPSPYDVQAKFNGGLIWQGQLTGADDLDKVMDSGIYGLSGVITINGPTNSFIYGVMIVASTPSWDFNHAVHQMILDSGTIYMRVLTGVPQSWTSWMTFVTQLSPGDYVKSSDLESLVTTIVNKINGTK